MAIIKPNNNTISAITALPAGIVSSDALASGVGGKVLQVVSAFTTGTNSTSTTSTVTFISASITPSSSSNKIFCMFNGLGYANGTNNSLTALIFRGTIGGTEICSTKHYDGGSDYHMYGLHCSVLDSPSTTSSQQYTIGFRPEQNLFCNMGNSGHNCTLTLMEIAG
jgi:hypothetical protein